MMGSRLSPASEGEAPVFHRRRRLRRVAAAVALCVALIPSAMWMLGDIVDGRACGRSWLSFGDPHSPVGVRSWVSVPLPVAVVNGVSIASYRVVGEGLGDADIIVRVADQLRQRGTGARSGFGFVPGSFGDRLDASIKALLREPVGTRLQVLSADDHGRSFDNVFLFVGAIRLTKDQLKVDRVEVEFKSGLRSQACVVPIHFTMIEPGTPET